MIPFVNLKKQFLDIEPRIRDRLDRVLAHGQFIMGPEVTEMEERLAEYVGVRHCVSVASGTEALLISLMAVGAEPGDEVITTPFTFVATVETIVLLGLKPVFVDVEPDTCNIDASKIEEKVTPRTKAIVPVSLYGQCADMDEINELAARHGDIAVIEDGAQSFGARYKGRRSCGLSTIGCTSFFPSKPLGCYGDGGALFTDDDELARAAREIRVHGQSQRYVHTRVGVGGRMDTLQCAVILAKLDRFDWEIEQRKAIGARYDELLKSGGITSVTVRDDRDSVFAQYTVMMPNRDACQAALGEAGVPTAVHYPVPLNEQPAYRHLCCPDCTPESKHVSERVMSLPMSADLDKADLEKTVQALLSFAAKHGV